MTSDKAEFVYKCTDYYNPKAEVSIAWNDNILSIQWPIENKPVLSSKDTNSLSIDEVSSRGLLTPYC